MSNFVQALKPRLRSFRESLYLLARNKLSLAAFILLIIIVLAAVAAPLIVPYPGDIEMDTHIADQLLPPSSEHWMGTDELGRDIFSRVVYGARISLTAAVAAVGLSLLIGIPLGARRGLLRRLGGQRYHAHNGHLPQLPAAAARHSHGRAHGAAASITPCSPSPSRGGPGIRASYAARP